MFLTRMFANPYLVTMTDFVFLKKSSVVGVPVLFVYLI